MTGTKTEISMTNYNRAVRAARSASAKVGTFNWTIGDLALSVATEYGENTIKRFADDIGQEVASVRNMRTVSATYPAIRIRRDFQSWTVYAVFASQDDAHTLVTHGNDGQPWTVSAARALVKSRNDAESSSTESDGTDGTDGTGQPGEIDKRAKLVAEITRLQGELQKAEAALAKYDADHPQAPARTTRRRLPKVADDGSDPLLASTRAKLDTVKPAPVTQASMRTKHGLQPAA